MNALRLATACVASTAIGLFAAGMAAAGDNSGVVSTHYDGVTNDLLTAGLGKTGLGSAVAPGFADALHPTAEELRRLAIYNNYRALIDPTAGGGYGTLYGPNVTANGSPTRRNTTCTGPRTCGRANAVRTTAWRATTISHARVKAGRSSAPSSAYTSCTTYKPDAGW